MLPGYTGVIVRDGYAATRHLTDALHAWCGSICCETGKSLFDFEPAQQNGASQMAGLLIEARDTAAAARLAPRIGRTPRPSTIWSPATGHSPPPSSARVARRFLSFEDLILRFATGPTSTFSNDLASHCTSWGRCAVFVWGGQAGLAG